MSGNSYGNLFKVTTFGESHGPAIGVVIDGVPPLLELDEKDIQLEVNRRRPGQSSITTPRDEKDKVEVISGIMEGKTTGTPLTILIKNEDFRSKDYSKIKDLYRPGHADYTYQTKYGIRDHRGGGRSSGRETACRVAAGAVAKKILKSHGIDVFAYTLAVGDIYAVSHDFSVIDKNPIRTTDLKQAELMIKKIEHAQKHGDSIGGIIEAIVKGCPVGLGDPAFDKLNAQLAHGVMSVGAIKGIEFGDGFKVAESHGSENNDALYAQDGKVCFRTNHGGGILGGISNGDDIILRAAVKPPSSIAKKQETVTKDIQASEIEVEGRHDPCICPRVVPVVEAMIALTVLDCFLIQKSIQ